MLMTGESFEPPFESSRTARVERQETSSDAYWSEEEETEKAAPHVVHEDLELMGAWNRDCPDLEALTKVLPDRRKLRALLRAQVLGPESKMAGRSEQEIREYSNLRGMEAYMLRMAQDAERMEVRLDREIAGDARVARMARKVLRNTPGDPAYFSTGISADARNHVRLGLLSLELQAKRNGILEEMVALATELPKMSQAGDKMLAAILKSNPQQALKAAPAGCGNP
jgi:hypothetical protein